MPVMAKDILLLIDAVPVERFRGIARYAKEHTWHMTIEDRPSYPPPAGWRGDGAIVMLNDEPRRIAYVKKLMRKGIPVVDLMDNRPDLRLPRVLGDSQAVGRLAADHFAERSLKHVAWFSAEWTLGHERRFIGFANAWKPHGTVVKWVFPPSSPVGGRMLANWLKGRLLDAPKPLGIFCYNDYDSADVLNVCLRGGLRVPEEVAILGVDDNKVLCESQPIPLSSVRYDHESVGYVSAQTLADLMNARRAVPSALEPVLIPPLGVATRGTTDMIAATDPLVKASMKWIAANLAHPIGASEVARGISATRLQLDRAFAADLGRSVGSEIKRQRIVEAKRLLMETDLKLEEIARQTGFCHASYFIRTFSGETGLTPHKFRRSHQLTDAIPFASR